MLFGSNHFGAYLPVGTTLVWLMSWCLDRAKVPVDGLVVDPYCGSGTTGVATLRRGGSFIGMECEPAHLATAARRLADAESDGVQAPMFPR